MAIVWQQHHNGVRYEVRAAGASRRLYTDGVFHSQFNPRQPLSGRVWDLLTLPAFFCPPESVSRVLVLGVGGGAVIRQLQHFVQPQEIVGVDIEPLHLQVARKYFGVRGKEVTLHEADAVQWLGEYRGDPFDMIIEDLFGACEGEPVRAVRLDGRWSRTLMRALSSHGVLTVNCVSPAQLRASALVGQHSVMRACANGFELRGERDDNAVGAFTRMPCSSRTLRRRLNRIPGMNPKLKSSPLRYRIRRLA